MKWTVPGMHRLHDAILALSLAGLCHKEIALALHTSRSQSEYHTNGKCRCDEGYRWYGWHGRY